MNERNLDVLASSVQKTNLWLKDVAFEIRIPRRHAAYAALRAVLHALRDCMPVDELANFSAQLPIFLTGVLFDGWKPKHKPSRHTRKQFLDHVRRALPGIDPLLATRGVLVVLSRHVTAGEIRAVRQILPREVRELWLDIERDTHGRDEVIRPRSERFHPPEKETRWTPGPETRRPWRPSDRYQPQRYGPR